MKGKGKAEKLGIIEMWRRRGMRNKQLKKTRLEMREATIRREILDLFLFDIIKRNLCLQGLCRRLSSVREL